MEMIKCQSSEVILTNDLDLLCYTWEQILQLVWLWTNIKLLADAADWQPVYGLLEWINYDPRFLAGKPSLKDLRGRDQTYKKGRKRHRGGNYSSERVEGMNQKHRILRSVITLLIHGGF